LNGSITEAFTKPWDGSITEAFIETIAEPLAGCIAAH
jgi:hypothetical protein